jgi:hydrogenase maturation protein HypF
MAENGLTGDIIGLAMDGTGYGTDGHVWGGEFLVADERSFTRRGHLKEFPLPGGAKAVREPWRIAAALLREAFGPGWAGMAEGLRLIPRGADIGLLERMMQRGINSPPTSSLGRLFDGVAAILGIRQAVTFEGQAAMELEGAAGQGSAEPLPFVIGGGEDLLQLDLSPAVRHLAEKKNGGDPRESLILAFHRTLARAFADMAAAIRSQTGLNRVALSGGCFQNRILLEGTLQTLGAAGFDCYTHRLVPTNDGGVALGQALCAASRWRMGRAAGIMNPLSSVPPGGGSEGNPFKEKIDEP